MEQPCGVCLATTPTGNHFGGVTCYPCRAFFSPMPCEDTFLSQLFRRVPERKRHPVCKKGGVCVVEGVTKRCSGCRFQKCLRAGLQLSQVLTGDQRRERFSSALRRKRLLQQEATEEAEVEATEEALVEQENVEEVEQEVHSDSSPSETESMITPNEPEAPGSLLVPKVETQQEVPQITKGFKSEIPIGSHQWAYHPPLQPHFQHDQRQPPEPLFGPLQSFRMPTQPGPSPFDPYTNNWHNHHIQQSHPPAMVGPYRSQMPQQVQYRTRLPQSIMLEPKSENRIPKQELTPLTPNPYQLVGYNKPPLLMPSTASISFQKYFQNSMPYKRPSVIHNKTRMQSNETSQKEKHPHMSIVAHPHATLGLEMEMVPGTEAIESDDDLISRYMHKKFDRSSHLPLEPVPTQRSSVIVAPTNTQLCTTSPAFDLEELLKSEELSQVDETNNSTDIESIPDSMFDLMKEFQDIPSSSITYIIEAPDMEKKQTTFFNAIHSVNMGENNLRDFINFAKNGIPPPQSFHLATARQLKERYVSAACALELGHVPKDLLHRALHQKLPLLHHLNYIAINSLISLDDNINFLLSFQDKQQWQVEASEVLVWPSARVMFRNRPGPEVLKREIARLFEPYNEDSLFVDRSIHMLMVALVLFDSQDSDERARRFHDVALNMLQGYLQVHRDLPKEDLQKIFRCLKDLPQIAQLSMKLWQHDIQSSRG